MRMSLKRGGLGLVCALLMTVTTSIAQSMPSVQQSPARMVVAECNVYPQTFHETNLASKQALHPDQWDASPQELLTQFPESLIKVNLDPSLNNFRYLSWLGSDGSSADLNTAFSNQGALAQGFNEATPPITDVVALAQVNQRLQIGDWVEAMPNAATPNLATLNTLVTNKTKLILPLHDLQLGNGLAQQYHVSRFVAVRLIGLSMVSNQKFMMFALLDDQPSYTCFNFDDQPTVNIPTTFTALMPFDAAISQIRWDFGDGTTSSGDVASHTYTQSGTYTVSLSLNPLGVDSWLIPQPFAAQGVVHVAPVRYWTIWIPTVQQNP